MEEMKENVNKKVETKIPLPLHPLPPLPAQLLKKKPKNIKKRQPLQTLAQENVLPSTSNTNSAPDSSTKKILEKLDTRFVTVRQKAKKLETGYNIYNEETDNDGTIEGNKQKSAITPPEKQLNLPVRNIKRSLRRPSSRELQGLSPADKTEETQEECSSLAVKRRLSFTETPERFQPRDPWIQEYIRFQDPEYTEDLIRHLMDKERAQAAVPVMPRLTRACLINWIIKVNGPFGNPATVQTACSYLDTILSTERVQLEKSQLVAMACYWIAQKMHGPVARSSRLTKISGNAFTQEMLLFAEKRIVLQLDYRLLTVVPQDFMAYLAWWCDKDRPGETEVAANFLCMSGMIVIKELSLQYPSAVACAAIICATTMLRGKDVAKRIQDCPVYKVAQTKTESIARTCALLRKAVLTVADPIYEYNAPLNYYGGPPYYIAHRIVEFAQKSKRARLE